MLAPGMRLRMNSPCSTVVAGSCRPAMTSVGAVIDAAHIANVEQPQAYTDAVLGFLAQK